MQYSYLVSILGVCNMTVYERNLVWILCLCWNLLCFVRFPYTNLASFFFFFSFLITRPPPSSPLFPSTPLSRSGEAPVFEKFFERPPPKSSATFFFNFSVPAKSDPSPPFRFCARQPAPLQIVCAIPHV